MAPDLFATRRLGFLAVVEEECTGNGTLRSITEHGVTAPEVVVLEPTDLGLMLGGVGVLWIDIDVVASSGHAYAADTHASAIDLGMRLVEGLRRWSAEIRRSEPEPSMAPTRALQPQSRQGPCRRLDLDRALERDLQRAGRISAILDRRRSRSRRSAR